MISMTFDNAFKLFEKYSSNTVAGTNNNFILKGSFENKTSAIYYKVQKHGKSAYRFCFSNCVDSTYGDGTECRANCLGGSWRIVSAFAGDGGAYGDPHMSEKLVPLSFSGSLKKDVLPGEIFWTDEAELEIPKNHYLCFEITFSGSEIPFTPDKIVPAFSLDENGFKEDKEFPQPIFVGIRVSKSKKVVFIGDSITQGLGTTPDKYEFWAARLAERLGKNFSFWNLGLGCGHAYDAVTDGSWLKKAKTGDTVFVCFGVNDINMHRSVTGICNDTERIVYLLKSAGCKVILLSVPPFDMVGEDKKKWYAVNDFLRNTVSKNADGFFDVSDIIGKPSPRRHMSLYGPHPDGNGGKALGDALYAAFGKLL